MAILFNKELTETEKFKIQITSMYATIDREHSKLMRIWEKDDPFAFLQSLGTDVRTIFQASAGLQQILKAANPDYIFLVPYIYEWETETQTNEFGEEVEVDVKKRYFVNPEFHEDGSIKALIKIT